MPMWRKWSKHEVASLAHFEKGKEKRTQSKRKLVEERQRQCHVGNGRRRRRRRRRNQSVI